MYKAIFLIALITLNIGKVEAADARLEILKAIGEHATEICGTVPLNGSQKSLNADARVSLHSLLKRLTGLGLDVGSSYKPDEYTGLVQSDLSRAYKSQQDCKMQVSNSLQQRLLPSTTPPKPTVKQEKHSNISPQPRPPKQSAQEFATRWLIHLDEADWGKAYNQLHDSQKIGKTLVEFSEEITRMYQGLGRVVSRESAGSNPYDENSELPPYGKYWLTNFNTTWESANFKATPAETVVLVLMPSGIWKVMGYHCYGC